MELRLCGVSETITRVVGGEVETACRTHSAMNGYAHARGRLPE